MGKEDTCRLTSRPLSAPSFLVGLSSKSSESNAKTMGTGASYSSAPEKKKANQKRRSKRKQLPGNKAFYKANMNMLLESGNLAARPGSLYKRRIAMQEGDSDEESSRATGGMSQRKVARLAEEASRNGMKRLDELSRSSWNWRISTKPCIEHLLEPMVNEVLLHEVNKNGVLIRKQSISDALKEYKPCADLNPSCPDATKHMGLEIGACEDTASEWEVFAHALRSATRPGSLVGSISINFCNIPGCGLGDLDRMYCKAVDYRAHVEELVECNNMRLCTIAKRIQTWLVDTLVGRNTSSVKRLFIYFDGDVYHLRYMAAALKQLVSCFRELEDLKFEFTTDDDIRLSNEQFGPPHDIWVLWRHVFGLGSKLKNLKQFYVDAYVTDTNYPLHDHSSVSQRMARTRVSEMVLQKVVDGLPSSLETLYMPRLERLIPCINNQLCKGKLPHLTKFTFVGYRRVYETPSLRMLKAMTNLNKVIAEYKDARQSLSEALVSHMFFGQIGLVVEEAVSVEEKVMSDTKPPREDARELLKFTCEAVAHLGIKTEDDALNVTDMVQVNMDLFKAATRRLEDEIPSQLDYLSSPSSGDTEEDQKPTPGSCSKPTLILAPRK